MTDTGSAELIKHASNSFLAMKISFINMVANLLRGGGRMVWRAKVAEEDVGDSILALVRRS